MEPDVFTIVPKGRYEVVESLGRGAFGTVYRGRDSVTGNPVVLKLIHLPSREALSRTDREIGLLRKLGPAPNIVSFTESYFSPDARSAVFVSEWIDGPSLQSLIEDYHSGLPDHVTVAVTRQLCRALAYLHQNQVVHRDIKPSNVLISTDGVVKLSDFGIAVSTSHDTMRTELTAVGSFVGTLRYAAPEMVSRQGYSAASDIYALGVTTMFMILGRHPLPEASVPFLMQEILRGSLLRELPVSKNSQWAAMLSVTLDISPDKRPSALSLLSMLERTFPAEGRNESAIVADFLKSTGDFRTPPPQPPRVITSAPERGDGDSLPDLVRSLTAQITETQSAVADITAIFSKRDLPDRSLSEAGPSSVTSEQRIDTTFNAIRHRLKLTWQVSLGMTFVLFALFVAMIVLAVVFGLVYGKSAWGIVFGGTSVLSLLTVIVWRPMDKMLVATIATQQLELVQINYQRALSGCREERREAFRDVSTQLHSLLTKIAPKSRS